MNPVNPQQPKSASVSQHPVVSPDRRQFLTRASVISGGLLLPQAVGNFISNDLAVSVASDEFSLPALPYNYDALESVIDKETMEIHHTKHHQSYINNLNAAVAANSELAGRGVEDLLRNIKQLPQGAQTAVRNHGGGHHNHSLFWKVMRSAKEDNQPTGRFADHLSSSFGSFDSFKEAFSKNAMDQFGSGWSWLVVSGDKLELLKTPNQDSPLMEGKKPLLGIDVWEHAYYLKYQNRRADYVSAWWKLVNWDEVASGLQA